MSGFKRLDFVLSLLLLFSCGKSLPHFEGIDENAFKSDKNGCTMKRYAMRESLENQKSLLVGVSEMDIMKLLGRPDRNELYERNEKFYYYFLLPSPSCQERRSDSLKLVVRFNALGIAREVYTE